MRRRLLALLAVAVLAAAACGDSSDDQETPPRDQDTGGGVEESAGGDVDAAGTISVKALDFNFEPAEITVEPGAQVTIELVNAGSATHSFTADSVNVDITADVGGSALAAFPAPGEDASIEFHCRFHSQMTGTIVVGAGGSGAGSGGSGEGEAEPEPDY
jgi:plastocyanin